MNRALQATVAACACVMAVGLAAQDATVQSKAKTKADDAKAMTIVGCVEGGHGAGFTLSHVTPGLRTAAPVGTAGAEKMTAYTLMPRSGLDLSAHVGHQVEITALALKPSAEEKGQVRVTPGIVLEDEPDQPARPQTRVEPPPRRPMPTLTVTSVKHLASSCPQ